MPYFLTLDQANNRGQQVLGLFVDLDSVYVAIELAVGKKSEELEQHRQAGGENIRSLFVPEIGNFRLGKYTGVPRIVYVLGESYENVDPLSIQGVFESLEGAKAFLRNDATYSTGAEERFEKDWATLLAHSFVEVLKGCYFSLRKELVQ